MEQRSSTEDTLVAFMLEIVQPTASMHTKTEWPESRTSDDCSSAPHIERPQPHIKNTQRTTNPGENHMTPSYYKGGCKVKTGVHHSGTTKNVNIYPPPLAMEGIPQSKKRVG